jgi:hypothetical protein
MQALLRVESNDFQSDSTNYVGSPQDSHRKTWISA